MTINNQNQLRNRLRLGTIISIFILGLFAFGYTASAEEQYSEDYFILKSEKIPASEDSNSDLLANGFDLEVDGARVSSPLLTGEFNLGGMGNCSGTDSFKLKGDRDTKNGTINGTFLYLMSGECPGGDGAPASPISLTWEGTFDGFATFELDPSDASKRIIEGKITNFQGESIFTLNDVKAAPTNTESITINFPKTVLEGYERGVTRKDSGMRFSGMTGQVEWRADNDPDGWKLCKLGDELPVGTHIRTQEDSSAILGFPDQSTFVLKGDSEVIIITPPEKESKIKLVAGNIWVNVKKMVTEGSFEIEMNQATTGIKGTTLVLEELNGVSTLKVIEGKVLFTPKVGGGETMVEGGSLITATAQGIGTLEKFDAEKESKDWETLRAGGESVENPVSPEKPASVEKPVSAGESAPALTGNSNKIIYFVIIGGVIFAGIILALIVKRKK